MNTTLIIIIIGILSFIIYWIFIKDGKFKQGVGELKKGDIYKARISFFDVLNNNHRHFKAHHYLGISYKDEAILYKNNQEKKIELNQKAISHFIKVTSINPKFGESNNMVEYLIFSESDDANKNKMLEHARKEISKLEESLKKEYSYLY